MRILKTIIVVAAGLLFLGIGYELWDNRNFLHRHETRTFDIRTGDELSLKVNENGSTGFANCWVNEAHCKNVRLSDTRYRQSLNSKMGMVGSGGWKYFTFLGLTSGVDTIKIHNCPVTDVNTGCDAFQDNISESDYTIIVKVTD
jgi:predicted secreted protein